MKPEIAFLVYEPLKQRHTNNSFDGNTNIGAYVVKDLLERVGHAVSFCTASTARQYRLVLVSFTSTFDVFSFYRHVALHPDWQAKARTFVALGGGFGMQNPTSIRMFLDYAAFGRIEGFLVPLVEALLEGRPYTHESVMHLPGLNPVRLAQAPTLYPHAIKTGTIHFQEEFTGCPLKCKFCHYTFARKHQVAEGQDEHAYVQTTLNKSGNEVTWEQVQTTAHKLRGVVSCAWDGASERLRFIYGKRISAQDIIQGIEHAGCFATKTGTILNVYNIGNFPGETKADWHELQQTLSTVRNRFLVTLMLRTTPFQPSLCTPMQWESVQLFPSLHVRAGYATIVRTPTFLAFHGSNEGPFSHLCRIVAERATPATDMLFHALCFAPQLQHGSSTEKLARVQAHFDLSPYLRAYALDEPHPGWFLSGWASTDQLRTIAQKMRVQMQRTIDDPGWLPGGATLYDAYQLRQKRAGLSIAE